LNSQRALVVGAGIGGLTAALCLAKKGFEVEVFEQSADISEVGAGIQLSPNSNRVLHYLGMASVLQKTAFRPDAAEIRHWKTGKILSTTVRGDSAERDYGFPYYNIHRADLISALHEAANDLSCIEIKTSSRVDRFHQTGAAAVLSCDDSDVHGDLIVGADGIHSAIRAGLFGEDKPRFTGTVAWRGLVPADKLPRGKVRPVTGLWWGPGKHFVHYYVRSGEMVNCVCVVEKTGWEVESWTQAGEHAELLRDFSGWHDTVCSLIEAMDPDECYKWALFDRAPMQSWTSGRVTLLGDACHPTLPFMAQGAAMAIEDAAILAASVAADGIESGLQRYQELRVQRTARIQNGSRRNAKVFHMRGVKAWVRNRAAARAAKSATDWIYRYDALNVVT
jgi:2-polyprenyl-6-methoxyphenol hydroxylase-like FAD-dependent oxidoreductase